MVANDENDTNDLMRGQDKVDLVEVEMEEEQLGVVDREGANETLTNFVLMAILFSANHGCTVSCLSLATARFQAVGAWQSGTLYLTYTTSAVLGATYITKELGARNSITMGMSLYCVYVGCFLLATVSPAWTTPAAITGAAIGGIGAGFLWTAQGAYFAQSAAKHASQLRQDTSKSTSYFAGFFAFLYLSEEVLTRLLSSALIEHLDWRAIFFIYTLIAMISTLGMCFVEDLPRENDGPESNERGIFFKVTAALHLLIKDPKMRYMVGLNAVFGYAGSFLNSYVNGEVVPSQYVGFYTSWMALTAALMSLVFSKLRKGPVLMFGSACFFFVAFLFIVFPNHHATSSFVLPIVVYTLHGMGRATFESTLKATFADYFPYEKEGAFANIILQNGSTSSIGYILSFQLRCKSTTDPYCVMFHDGTRHYVLGYELLVCVTAILAIAGYLRASQLHRNEQAQTNNLYTRADVLEEGEEDHRERQ